MIGDIDLAAAHMDMRYQDTMQLSLHVFLLHLLKPVQQLIMKQFVLLFQALIVCLLISQIAFYRGIRQQDELYALAGSICQFKNCGAGNEIQSTSRFRTGLLRIDWSNQIESRTQHGEEMFVVVVAANSNHRSPFQKKG